MAGQVVGHYQVLEKLGEGGMGVVYKARDTRLGRSVAIKVVNAEFTQRFEREAKAISALNHPHICTLYDVGEHEGSPYLVMEYVEGRPLKGPLPASDALRYAVQIGEALAAAHKAGIVHRDLKPDNILLTSQGGVKVLDFGLAKLQPTLPTDAPTLTMTMEQGAIAGTGPYMSPEQAQGEPVDARSDIFSFGAVLYELLSGRRAFRRETIGATLAAVIASEPPPLLEAPPDAARIVAKMLAKKREGRYQSAEELLADLDAAAQPGSRFMPRRLWFIEEFRGLPFAAALLVLAVALVAGSIWWPRGKDVVPSRPEVVTVASVDALQQAKEYLQRYDRKGNVDRAIDTLQAALQRDPSHAGLHAALAEAYVRKSRRNTDKPWLKMAIESGRNAVAANGDLAVGHSALGMALSANGQKDKAKDEFERALDFNPRSWQAYLGLAKLGPPDAEQLYLTAVRYSANEWSVYHELAGFYYDNLHYDKSIDMWREASKLSPRNVMVLGNLGAPLNAIGRYAEAAGSFQDALELDGTDGRIWTNLGTARYFQGDFKDAVRAMKKAVDLSPGWYMNWGNLGDSYRWAEGLKSNAGSAYEKAIGLARKELAANPKNAEIRGSLAVYLAKSGDTAGALAELAKVEKVSERDKGSILFKTALVYEVAGDRVKALDALGRAIEAGYSRHEIAHEPELADLRSDPDYRSIAGAGVALKK